MKRICKVRRVLVTRMLKLSHGVHYLYRLNVPYHHALKMRWHYVRNIRPLLRRS